MLIEGNNCKYCHCVIFIDISVLRLWILSAIPNINMALKAHLKKEESLVPNISLLWFTDMFIHDQCKGTQHTDQSNLYFTVSAWKNKQYAVLILVDGTYCKYS